MKVELCGSNVARRDGNYRRKVGMIMKKNKNMMMGVGAQDFLLNPLWASAAYELLCAEQEAKKALEETPDDVGRHLEELRRELLDEIPDFNLDELRQMNWQELKGEIRKLREVTASLSQQLSEARDEMDRLNTSMTMQDAMAIELMLNNLRRDGVIVYELGPVVQLHAVFGRYSTHLFKAAPSRQPTAIRLAMDDMASVAAEAEKHDASLTEEQCELLHRAQVMAGHC